MAEKMELDNAFSDYANRMIQVSRLSSPSLDAVEEADDYSLLLHHNFKRIGELAEENCEVIDRFLLPLLHKEEALSEEEIGSLERLNSLLINMNVAEARDIDIHLAELTSERIEMEREKEMDENAGQKTDRNAVTPVEDRIRLLDKRIDIAANQMYRRGGKDPKTRDQGLSGDAVLSG